MVRTLLTKKILRAKPKHFDQLIKAEAEVVLSILKNLSILLLCNIVLFNFNQNCSD